MEFTLKAFNELNINELYEILSLRSEIFVVEQNCAYQDLDYKDQKSMHLFATQQGKIVSYVRILEKEVSYEEMSIGRVVVHKDYRRKEIASLTMKKAIEIIEEKFGQNKIRISAQAHLENFYGALGFKKVSEVYLEDGIPHIEMLYEGQ